MTVSLMLDSLVYFAGFVGFIVNILSPDKPDRLLWAIIWLGFMILGKVGIEND